MYLVPLTDILTQCYQRGSDSENQLIFNGCRNMRETGKLQNNFCLIVNDENSMHYDFPLGAVDPYLILVMTRENMLTYCFAYNGCVKIGDRCI